MEGGVGWRESTHALCPWPTPPRKGLASSSEDGQKGAEGLADSRDSRLVSDPPSMSSARVMDREGRRVANDEWTELARADCHRAASLRRQGDQASEQATQQERGTADPQSTDVASPSESRRAPKGYQPEKAL